MVFPVVASPPLGDGNPRFPMGNTSTQMVDFPEGSTEHPRSIQHGPPKFPHISTWDPETNSK